MEHPTSQTSANARFKKTASKRLYQRCYWYRQIEISKDRDRDKQIDRSDTEIDRQTEYNWYVQFCLLFLLLLLFLLFLLFSLFLLFLLLLLLLLFLPRFTNPFLFRYFLFSSLHAITSTSKAVWYKWQQSDNGMAMTTSLRRYRE